MSIRKRTLKKSTVWQVDYRDEAGHRRHKQFGRKKDADAFERETNAAVLAGTHVSDSASRTVRQAGASWIARCRLNQLEESTIVSYQGHLDLHIYPLVGDILLTRFGKKDAEKFYEKLLAEGRSPDLVRRVRISFGALTDHAMMNEWVATNPIKAAKFRVSKRKSKRPSIPTKAEMAKIRAHTSADDMPKLLTKMFAALRSSEFRGLPWRDVNLKEGTISVTQRADRWGIIGIPKSAAGTRDIDIPPIAVSTLREWKLRCPRGELDLVFPNGLGKVENHANIANRFFYEVQIKAGVVKKVPKLDCHRKPVVDENGQPIMVIRPKYSLHSLRHYGISIWIESAYSPKKVQILAGHSSIQVTFDRYGHLFEARDRDKAKIIEVQQNALEG